MTKKRGKYFGASKYNNLSDMLLLFLSYWKSFAEREFVIAEYGMMLFGKKKP